MEKANVTREKSALAEALTPRQIVEELDKYIIGQFEAKRCVAIALRNRARRQMLGEDIQDEVSPKNIIMIGSTGVGKTEIARRLARLVDAPFIKVEASKYTEIGYVGRDVESMIRDLTETAISRVKAEQTEIVEEKAREFTEERLLDCIFPIPRSLQERPRLEKDMLDEPAEEEEDMVLQLPFDLGPDAETDPEEDREKERERHLKTREKFREWLREGRLEDKPVEINVKHQVCLSLKFSRPAVLRRWISTSRICLVTSSPTRRRNDGSPSPRRVRS